MIRRFVQRSWRNRLIFLLGVVFLFLCAGGVIFLLLPPMAGSAAEIVASSRVASIDGLARFQQIDPRRGVEFQNVLQLLTSRAAAEFASQKVGGYAPEEVSDRTALKINPESGLVTVSVTAGSSDRAKGILTAILDKAAALDREQQAQRAEQLVSAVQERLASVDNGLKECTRRIADFLIENKVTINIDAERQRSTAGLLAQYHQNELALRIQSSRLASMLRESTAVEDVPESRISDALDAGRDRETPVDEARRRLDETQADVARLESRYGKNHPELKSAKAQLEEAQNILSLRMREATKRVKINLHANESALGEIARQSDDMEDHIQSSDISLNPEYVGLIAEQENYRLLQRQLGERLIELQVYQGAFVNSFEVISAPYSVRSRNLKALLAVLALSVVLGAVAGSALLYAVSRTTGEVNEMSLAGLHGSAPELAE